MPKHYHNLLKFTGKVFHFSQEKYRKEKNWNGKQRWKSSSAAILLELEEVERRWWQSPGRPAPAQLRQGLTLAADISQRNKKCSQEIPPKIADKSKTNRHLPSWSWGQGWHLQLIYLLSRLGHFIFGMVYFVSNIWRSAWFYWNWWSFWDVIWDGRGFNMYVFDVQSSVFLGLNK